MLENKPKFVLTNDALTRKFQNMVMATTLKIIKIILENTYTKNNKSWESYKEPILQFFI